jgi:16S rRNA (adenine1518-N6/adenine1519-N6)-dimethyltransferase
VIAIEKDKKFCEILKQELKDYKNVEIINTDILKYVGHSPAAAGHIKYKIVANLPYYITSPVIRKFLEIESRLELMILMVQKEVAERIIAKNGKMSLLSVSVQFYAKPEIVSYVSKNSFYPSPKVDSAIIKIIPQQIPEINTKKFFSLVRVGFSSKRKKLKNNLKIDENTLEEIGLDPNIRAEKLSIKDWLNLYEIIESKK